MKLLVVYYSRTGITRQVAEAVGRLAGCQCDVEEIVDLKDRSGPLGYLGGGKDAMLKRPTQIRPLTADPAGYDVVAVGTPVWAATMAPAVRTWLAQTCPKLPKVAFFCTMGGAGDQRTLRDMAELAGKPPVATVVLREKQVKAGGFDDLIRPFAETLAKD